jgi:4-hydroxy-tetrahydrodipicolinate synthase
MFKGCGTALVTPFAPDGSLDESTLRRLVRRQVADGIHFLVPGGTTGESPTLTRNEHLRLVEVTLEEVAGRVPVVAGCGGYNTAKNVSLAAELHAIGVQGLLSVTPYYNKPTPEGLYRHYDALAAATELPIVVYNVPGRTCCNIRPDLLCRLAGIANIVAVKEASGDIGQMARVCQYVPEGFSVLSGDDSVTLPLMALGGWGVISVVSNEVPGPMATLCDLALAGDFAGARAVHRRYLPLMDVNFCETSPGPVKVAMERMGLLDEARYRLPMTRPSAASCALVCDVLETLGVLREAAVAAVS